MVDVSHHETDENLAKTKQLVAFCHAHGVATEAEPGRLDGGEDGVADTADLEGALTKEEQVEDFIATGIDFLTPAFGNVHGEYRARGPQPDFDPLESICQKLGGRVRMVLHGTNDFPEALMNRCIRGGVSKVNVNKLVLDDYLAHLKKNASSLNLTMLMEEGVKEAQKLTEWQMDVCKFTGKA